MERKSYRSYSKYTLPRPYSCSRRSFFEDILENFSNEDRVFFQRMLTAQSSQKNIWIEQYIKNDLTKKEFIYLLNYPRKGNESFINDLKLVNHLYYSNLICQNEEKKNLEIKFSYVLDKFIEDLSTKNQEGFFDILMSSSTLLKSGALFCSQLQEYESEISIYPKKNNIKEKHKIYLSDFMEKISNFMSNSHYFKLAQFMTRLSVLTKEDKNKQNLKYFFNFLQSDLYQGIDHLNKFINDQNNELFSDLYSFLKRMPSDGYESIGSLNYSLFSKENSTFHNLGKAWKVFSRTGKKSLLNIFSAHFNEEVDLISLLSFYSNFLALNSEDIELISEALFNLKDSEKTLDAIGDIAKHFKGPEVLTDFESFFSRDHILKIIEIISQGLKLKNEARLIMDQFLVDGYLDKINNPKFNLSMPPGKNWLKGPQARDCIQSLNSKDIHLYNLIKELPSNCRKLKDDNYGLFILNSLSLFDKSYRDLFSSKESLFDGKGILNKSNLYSLVSYLKAVDESYKKGDQKGIVGIIDNLSNYFSVDKKYKYENLIKIFYGLVSFFDGDSADSISYRNILVQKISSKQKRLKEVLDWAFNGFKLIRFYKNWTLSKEKISFRKRYENLEKSEYRCENYQNKKIGGAPCPSGSQIKTVMHFIMDRLKEKYSEDLEPAAIPLLKSFSSTEGLKIPYESNEQRTKRLSISEMIKMQYDLSDKTLKSGINSQKMTYLPNLKADEIYFTEKFPNYKKTFLDEELKSVEVKLTTLERMEMVMREIRFDQGYLGFNYMNATVKSENYNKTLSSKKSILKNCSKISFCGKHINKLEKRMVKNAIKSYDALADLNIKENWRYGDFSMAFLTTLVSSSLKIVQKNNLKTLKFIPKIHNNENLKKHNGRILMDLSMIGFFTNISRVIRDRVGSSSDELEKFLNSKELRYFDQNILRNIDFKKIEPTVISLIDQLRTRRMDGSSIVDDIIDFASDLNYEETRILEDSIIKGLVIASFIGLNTWNFSESSLGEMTEEEINKLKQKYSHLNQEVIFQVAEKLLPYYSIFKSAWPQEINLMNVFRKLNNVINFFFEGLFANNKSDNFYFVFLNNSAKFLKAALVNEDIHSISNNHLESVLSQKQSVQDIYASLLSLDFFVDDLFFKSSESASDIISLITNLREDKRLDFDSFREYLKFTTKETVCTNNDGFQCKSNSHFDEPIRLIWLSIKEPNPYLIKIIENTLFFNRFKLEELLKWIIPSIVLN